ncbi:MAG: 50S ribosome-binding GTPase [Deltaproteobacteria bacterium]|nr:50S ribosome-binding GTPase [Deltaproteobacteria bacterium]
MEERSLHIVIVGSVDHGKSTLIGRLFFDSGSLPPEKLEEVKRVCAELGRPLEFAYVMDNLEEERTRGITIDIAHTFFATPKRKYVIIDAPGHKEFLKNMISGSSQAEAAILLVEITRGIQEQTLRHCYILSLLGIKQVVVTVNKMDLAGYSEAAFLDLKKRIEEVTMKYGITPSYIIPISAMEGENVAAASDKLSWYKGPTVLQALDNFEEMKIEEKGARFPVQDVYEISGQKIVAGRIEAGRLIEGQGLWVLPGKTKAKVASIKKYLEPDLKEAQTGECVGLILEGAEVKRGDILSETLSPTITRTVHANIFWMIDKDYKLGIPLTFKCATQETRGKIERIRRRFDPASEKEAVTDAASISQAEVAEVDITLSAEVAIERFSDIPELGRFVLEHDGRPVAGGIII